MEPWMQILVAVVPAMLAVAGLSWKARDWLAREFTETRKSFHDVMNAHEKLDQRRHTQNLKKFSDIRVALVRSGGPNIVDLNGDHDVDDDDDDDTK